MRLLCQTRNELPAAFSCLLNPRSFRYQNVPGCRSFAQLCMHFEKRGLLKLVHQPGRGGWMLA